MTKSYEMNTIFETAINRQIEVQTAAYSFGEEAVSKCEVSFLPRNPKDCPVSNLGPLTYSHLSRPVSLQWTVHFDPRSSNQFSCPIQVLEMFRSWTTQPNSFGP